MKNTIYTQTTRPHVKWGALALSVVLAILGLTFLVLCLTKTLVGIFVIDIMISYGLLPGCALILLASFIFFEEFEPSYDKYKQFKRVQAYKAELRKTVMSSIRSNRKHENELWKEFQELYPQYKG